MLSVDMKVLSFTTVCIKVSKYLPWGGIQSSTVSCKLSAEYIVNNHVKVTGSLYQVDRLGEIHQTGSAAIRGLAEMATRVSWAIALSNVVFKHVLVI